MVFEPELDKAGFFGSRVLTDLHQFKEEADVIVANRKTESLRDVDHKVFSRDLFGDN